MGGMGAMPVAGLGNATMVGKLSAPPSWAGRSPRAGATPATAVETVGWTAAAPQAGPGTIVPGMPGLGAAARNSAGFGAPRYGVKPIVMPKTRPSKQRAPTRSHLSTNKRNSDRRNGYR